MKRTIIGVTLFAMVSLAGLSVLGKAALASGRESSQEASDPERVAKNKTLVLDRLTKRPPAFRGDKPGEIRLRWEWYNRTVSDYLYQKQVLVAQLSANEKYMLRAGWVYKDMKVTFEEILRLGADQDDLLVPVLAHNGLLTLAPAATFEGLTLRGKKGEVKGKIIRKFTERIVDLRGRVRYCDRLEYRDEAGRTETAGSRVSNDAFNVRWRDIKDRVADDVSQFQVFEDVGFLCSAGS